MIKIPPSFEKQYYEELQKLAKNFNLNVKQNFINKSIDEGIFSTVKNIDTNEGNKKYYKNGIKALKIINSFNECDILNGTLSINDNEIGLYYMIHYYGLDGTNKTFEQCLEEMKEEATVNKNNKNNYINDYLINNNLQYTLQHYIYEKDYYFKILGKDIEKEYLNNEGSSVLITDNNNPAISTKNNDIRKKGNQMINEKINEEIENAMDASFTAFHKITLDDEPTSINNLEDLIKELSAYKNELTELSEEIKEPYNKNYISYDDGSDDENREPEKINQQDSNNLLKNTFKYKYKNVEIETINILDDIKVIGKAVMNVDIQQKSKDIQGKETKLEFELKKNLIFDYTYLINQTINSFEFKNNDITNEKKIN